MPLLSKEQAQQFLEKAIRFSKADEVMLRFTQSAGGNTRYARSSVTTSGDVYESSLSVTSTFGRRTGTATGNEFGEGSLKELFTLSEELAKLSPENPEYMPMLPQQNFAEATNFNGATAAMKPQSRSQHVYNSISATKAANLESAGYVEDTASVVALMNSNGLFAYNQGTQVDFSVTVRTPDGTGSGYAARSFNDIQKLDTRALTETAISKAKKSAGARRLEPGKYTVILEPLAVENMMSYFFQRFDAREADEGRSFLGRRGGGSRVGEKLFDERVTVWSDPLHPDVPTTPFSNDGEPLEKTTWIQNGVVKNLSYSQYWAKQQGKKPLPSPNNYVVAGGSSTLDQMISNTERGILVTRFWYIRLVDQQTVLLTGLTRDGTFLIEDGKVQYPVMNFRFNESPVTLLANLEDIGITERCQNMMVPPMKIRNFNFTSLSDAV